MNEFGHQSVEDPHHIRLLAQLQRCFNQELIQKGIADLGRGAVLSFLMGVEILGRKGRAVKPSALGPPPQKKRPYPHATPRQDPTGVGLRCGRSIRPGDHTPQRVRQPLREQHNACLVHEPPAFQKEKEKTAPSKEKDNAASPSEKEKKKAPSLWAGAFGQHGRSLGRDAASIVPGPHFLCSQKKKGNLATTRPPQGTRGPLNGSLFLFCPQFSLYDVEV